MGRPLTPPPPPRGLRIHSGRGRDAETRPLLPSTASPAQKQRRPLPPLSAAGGRAELRAATYASGPAARPVASSSRNRGRRPAATASPVEFQLGAAALAAQPPGPHLPPGDKRMRRPASRAAPGKCGAGGCRTCLQQLAAVFSTEGCCFFWAGCCERLCGLRAPEEIPHVC